MYDRVSVDWLEGWGLSTGVTTGGARSRLPTTHSVYQEHGWPGRLSQGAFFFGSLSGKLPDMQIVALDPATQCGFAHSRGVSGTWDLSVRRDESAGMRLIRLRGKLNEMFSAEPFQLLVYEAARHGAAAMQGALVIQAMLQAVIVTWCEDNKVEYRGYSPSEIKKFATGKGNANKAAMVKAAKLKWPQVRDDNEADALWLLEFARSTYGKAG